ncbi:MAG: site-2 protease family protein [Candidatus Omnitrophica bacterium]|nr:site-2 protease family protein [Candidatus Omnitrophota bacterium]
MNILLFVIVLAVFASVHEYAHGWVAYKLGDPTAKYAGRLTLNPLAHIDPMMSIFLPLFLLLITRGTFAFAAAKPVPVNFNNLRNPRQDMVWVGLAGPASNFICAIVLSILLKIPFLGLLSPLFQIGIFVNMILGVFNLIPIPPLDGSRVLMGLLPREFAYSYARLEPYGFLILMGLIFMGLIRAIFPIIIGLCRILGVDL